MTILWILLLWVIPGIVSIFVTLKGIREERCNWDDDELYNTVGDLGIAIAIGVAGIVGLIASVLVTYQDFIIKKFNKKL